MFESRTRVRVPRTVPSGARSLAVTLEAASEKNPSTDTVPSRGSVKRVAVEPAARASATGTAGIAKPKEEPSSAILAVRTDATRSVAVPEVTFRRTGPRVRPLLDEVLWKASLKKTVWPGLTVNVAAGANDPGE